VLLDSSPAPNLTLLLPNNMIEAIVTRERLALSAASVVCAAFASGLQIIQRLRTTCAQPEECAGKRTLSVLHSVHSMRRMYACVPMMLHDAVHIAVTASKIKKELTTRVELDVHCGRNGGR
jgi:hypothetical protein